jgi:cytochrome P450
VRAGDRDDIITLLVNAYLTQREFEVYFVLLTTAGNETTRHTITHGLLALLDYPDQLERLRNDPSLFKQAADEMLRWATAGHYFRRTTTEDTVLADTEIPTGAKVTTWLVSGNRDETVFENPDTFDVGGEPNKRMAFGPCGLAGSG